MSNVALAEGLLSSPEWDALMHDMVAIHENSERYQNWQVTVISGLIFTLKNEYELLRDIPRVGIKSISRLAFHSRNIFELTIWCAACEKNPENLRTLYEDAGRDAKDLMKGFDKWGTKAQENETYFEDMKEQHEFLEKAAKEQGILDLEAKYTKVSELAKIVGMGNHYDIIYKFLSKFSHPTALQIVGEFSPEVWANLNSAVYEQGCVNFIGTFQALQKFIKGLMDKSF